MIDSIAYMATMTILFSLLFSELAFVCYDRECGGWMKYRVSSFLLLSVFCFDQMGMPVFFVLFVITPKREGGIHPYD